MQLSLLINKISTSVLIGIAILAFIALTAESLPEVEAKLIVIPTLILIILWTACYMVISRSLKKTYQ
jgi:hypothetical protein